MEEYICVYVIYVRLYVGIVAESNTLLGDDGLVAGLGGI